MRFEDDSYKEKENINNYNMHNFNIFCGSNNKRKGNYRNSGFTSRRQSNNIRCSDTDLQIFGASSDEGITESSINLSIALKVQRLLEMSGSTVILTRSDEDGIYALDGSSIREKKVSDIKKRVKIGNGSSADIFVSIHLNKLPQKQYWGWQTFYKNGYAESKKLAQSLQLGLNETIQKENKRESLKIENIYIVDHVEIPIAIVECGFLSNEEEEKLLQTEEYQNKLAWGIYVGIMNYFY